MHIYYVYILLDPREPGVYKFGEFSFDYKPFYVGKGHGKRYKDHFKVKKTDNLPVKNKIRKIIQSGSLPLYTFPYRFLSENEAYAKEIEVIKIIGKENLTNICDGGKGASSDMMRGEKNPQFGKKRPIWIINKMQAARKITNSLDKIGKTYEERYGKEKSQEIKLSLSKIRKGKTYEEIFGEEKTKIIKEAQKIKRLGRKHSEETKKKMQVAQTKEIIKKRVETIIEKRKLKFDMQLDEYKTLILTYIEKELTDLEIQKRITSISKYKLKKMLNLLRTT